MRLEHPQQEWKRPVMSISPAESLAAAVVPPAEGSRRLSLAKIRHSLRTPINHIIGYAEILREEAAERLPSGFVTDLERIHSSGYVLMALINRYLGEDCQCAAELNMHAVCHELRTPVTHIIGYGEMLAEQCEEMGEADLKPDLEKIVSAANIWLSLMEDHLRDPATWSAARSAAGGAAEPVLEAQRTWLGMARPQEPPPIACGGHLLLADDDDANRELLRRRLEKLGYRITVCDNGGDALGLARSVAPDLVLLDMLMPVLDGNEVLIRMKSDESLHDVPVIMISALDQVEGIAHCIELGAEDYLAKPFNPILLRARIGAALEKKRLHDAEHIYLRQIEDERARSDRLLLNILPRPIADRLKSGESRVVNSYDQVTVLFADLVGFTVLSSEVPPSVLVRLLDQIFSAFDELACRHGLEKIKTIGDAYMAAAGLPFPRADHAEAAARMALDMHDVIGEISRSGRWNLNMRIGLCTGPVIAGIIGQNKFTYDLWGDTVNTASRMESHGIPGRTQVPQGTYDLIAHHFRFEERGTIEVKGKGHMKTYFLCGR